MPETLTITLANRIGEISRLGAQVAEFGERLRLSGRAISAVNLALEELAVNIISYAWDDGGDHVVHVALSVEGKKLTATIRDDGKPFNPLSVADVPNPAISLDKIEDLELGLRLVRMMVDSLHYARQDGCNILMLGLEDVPGKETITSMLCEKRVFPPSAEFCARARVRSLEEYRELYRRSLADPEGFWAEKAAELRWYKKWDKVLSADFAQGRHEWFVGGKLNVSVNCLDRHLEEGRGDKAALLWEGEGPGEQRTLTYRDLHREVCRFANVLKRHGVGKGDRVSLYLPLIPELAIAVLACARIGAIHSVVFGGFSAEALRDRIRDCDSKLLVCADGYARGGKLVRSKDAVDAALSSCPGVKTVIVVRHADCRPSWQAGRDRRWDEEMAQAGDACAPEVMDAEDPLFILYTSGSTGKPKGVLHTSGGYLVYAMQTFKYVFDIRDEDVYWCTADIGWITGHSYLVYGPLANGATCVMYEGAPAYPRPDRFWEIVAKRRVTIFYTAPTALRALMKEGDDWPRRHDLSSLRLLGSVGEPINPEAWMWYHEVIGGRRCPIVDTWWQTETGGIMVSPLPGAVPGKPGSAALPFFGIEPAVVRDDLTPAAVNEGGWLVIKRPWPGLMRRVYGDPERFRKTYFSRFFGVYTTGDGARIDEDGYLWLMGRIDDVIKVSGHRLGTAEIESALVSHHAVAEAAVVGVPHDVKGEAIYAFVSLKTGVRGSAELAAELTRHVRGAIGALAAPERIQFAEALPKTRSGKIMRRILARIAAGDCANLGDTTTLTDPGVVAELVRQRASD